MFNSKYMILLALTMELVTMEVALIFTGSWLDQYMSWPGYGVMLGAIIGFAAWVFHLVVVLKKLEGENQ